MKKVALLTLLCLLAACGFRPIYGDHGAGSTPVAVALNNIAIDNIPDRNGQIFRNHLIDRFYGKGRPKNPTSRLSVSLAMTETSLGILKDATSSRSELNLTANFVLRDMEGKTLLSGSTRASVSFSKLSAQYGTLAAKEDANNRALIEAAEEMVNRLSLYFAEEHDIAKDKAPENKP